MKRIALVILLATAGLLPAQESLTPATVAADRRLWPREVTVTAEHQVPLLVNGKPAGTMKAPAGRTYPLLAVTATGVQVNALGTPLTLPSDQTDLLTRAGQTQAALAAATPPPAVPTAPLAAAPTPVPKPSAPPAIENTLAAALDGKLVTRIGTKLEPFDAKKLAAKRYLAIYFSATWCPPCRQFTPELVSWYKRKKSSLENFDIIFVSRDRAPQDMEKYMKDDKMDWPALDYATASDRHPLSKYSGRGIPCLVLLDEKGQVLSDSYQGDQYLGPDKVMKDLDKLLRDQKSP